MCVYGYKYILYEFIIIILNLLMKMDIYTIYIYIIWVHHSMLVFLAMVWFPKTPLRRNCNINSKTDATVDGRHPSPVDM